MSSEAQPPPENGVGPFTADDDPKNNHEGRQSLVLPGFARLVQSLSVSQRSPSRGSIAPLTLSMEPTKEEREENEAEDDEEGSGVVHEDLLAEIDAVIAQKTRPYLRGENNTFNLHASSLFVFSADLIVRKKVFVMIDHRYFERCVLGIIFLNCISIILSTPVIVDLPGVAMTVFVCEIVFQALFTLEMLLKVFALGFVLHEHSYLRSAWNAMDFLIVVLGFVSVASETNFSSFRMFRVLKPLKAVAKIPELSALVSALIASAPRMRDVLLLLTFVLFIFSVLGLQLFSGAMHQRCYADINDYALNNVTGRRVKIGTHKELVPYDTALCSQTTFWGHQCPTNTSCEVHKDIYMEPVFHYDNFGNAFLSVFHIVSGDNWPQNVWQIQGSSGSAYFLFGFVCIIVGGQFCLNLILAILSSEYNEASEKAQEKAREVAREEALLDAQEAEANGADAAAADDEEMLSPTAGANYQPTALTSADDTRSATPPPEFVGTAEESGMASHEPTPNPSRRQSMQADPAEPPSRHGHRTRKPGCWLTFRRSVLRFVRHDWFSRFMLFVTVVNVAALAIDHHPIDDTFEYVLNMINFVCSLIFIAEFLLKFFAMGLSYFRDPFNVFDSVLVCISIPEMILSQGNEGSAFSALRAFRLLRVFRVVRASKTVKALLVTVFKAALGASYLFLLLLLYVLVAALIGVDLFETTFPDGFRPNFHNLGDGLLAVFIVITGENWMSITEQAMLGSNPAAVLYFLILFCVGSYIVLNLFVAILIDSFDHEDLEEEEPVQEIEIQKSVISAFRSQSNVTALNPPGTQGVQETPEIVVNPSGIFSGGENTQEKERLSGGERENKSDDAAETRSAILAAENSADFEPQGDGMSPTSQAGASTTTFIRLGNQGVLEMKHRKRTTRSVSEVLASIFGKKARKGRNEDYNFCCFSYPPSQPLTGNSFLVFSPTNPFRRFVAHIVDHPYFDLFIVVCIFVSCVMLGFDCPEYHQNPRIVRMLDITDKLFFAIFAFEALLNCIAWGVIGENSYLANPWSRLDAAVVIAALLGLFLPYFSMLRALRSFKLGARAESLRVVIGATFTALPNILNVVALILFGFIVFGILGVQLMMGDFVYCTDPNVIFREDCVGNFTITETDTALVNGDWVITTTNSTGLRSWEYPFFNFNNLGNGLLTLFALAINDGWSAILWQAIDSNDYDEAMRPYSRPYMGIFVVAFVIFGSFFMMNLFVGSLIDSFSQERDKKVGRIDAEGRPMMSEEQAEWLRAYRIATAARIQPPPPPPENPIRELCCYLYFAKDSNRRTVDPKFEYLITALILLNSIVMCIQYDDAPDEMVTALFWINVAFTIIYTIEALFKMIALMPSGYFRDPWNRFDICLIPLSYFSLFIGGPGTNALRVLRVARVLRLIKRADGLARLFNTVLYAIPQLINVMALLFLTLFVFATIGVELFGRVATRDAVPESSLHEFANFWDAGRAMILLFEIATTEGWSDIMKSCLIMPHNSGCTAGVNCGTYAAIPYFILFMIAANSICINLFIFVVVDNYLEVQSLSKSKAAKVLETIELFRDEWSTIDVAVSRTMHWELMLGIMKRLDLPGVVWTAHGDGPSMKLMTKLNIPIDHAAHVEYDDCIRGLTRFLYGLNEEQTRELMHDIDHDAARADESAFKVHHAIAARMICRRWKHNMRAKMLARKVLGKLSKLKSLHSVKRTTSLVVGRRSPSNEFRTVPSELPGAVAEESDPQSTNQETGTTTSARNPHALSPGTNGLVEPGQLSAASSGNFTPGGDHAEATPRQRTSPK
jgi:hypothetical protein